MGLAEPDTSMQNLSMASAGWTNPAHFQRCAGKYGFRSMAKAEREAERVSNKLGELVLAYTCCDCGLYHIGHADLSQRLARVPHVEKPCEQCGGVIPCEKKHKAKQYGSTALYCSDTCQRTAAKIRREAREVRKLAPGVAQNQP